MKQKQVFFNSNSSRTYIPEDNIIRVFDKDLTKNSVLNYLSLYALIEDSELSVPKILKIFKTFEGTWAVLQENVKGKTFEEIFNTEPDMCVEYLDSFIELQMEVGKMSIEGLGSLNDKLEEQIKALDLASDRKNELLELLSTMPRGTSLVNGKMLLLNIVETKDEDTYITEWSEMTSGVPAAEAAGTYLYLCCNSTELAENYLKLFSKKSSIPLEDIRKWIPLMGAGQYQTGTISTLHSELIMPWLGL